MSLCNIQDLQQREHTTNDRTVSYTHTNTGHEDFLLRQCFNIKYPRYLYIYYTAESTTIQFLKVITRIHTVNYNYKYKNNLYNTEHAPFSL